MNVIERSPCVGIRTSDGVAVLGGEPVPVNPCSKYEDMKFSPDADGVYEFYLNMAGETPSVYVRKP